MVTFRPYKTSVSYKAETTFGTPVIPDAAVSGKITNFTLNRSNNLQRITGLGEGRNETFVALGNFECTWSMEYLPGDFAFLQFAVGAQTGSGTAVSPYVLTEADFRGTSALNTATIEAYSMGPSTTHDVDTLTSCIINTFSITASVGNPVTVSCEGFAQKTVSKATAGVTPIASATKPYMFQQGTFNWNGNAVARVTSFTMNFNNNIDPEAGRGLGDRFVQEWEPGLRKYDGVLTVRMTETIATTLRDHFYGAANQPSTGVVSAEPTFYAAIMDFSEGASSGHRNAQITLTDCAINDISKPINIGENLVELTINLTAKKGTSSVALKYWTV
jgi:hypothetical protein